MTFSRKYTEEQLQMAQRYVGASIKNVVCKSPMHNPTNFFVYAELYDKDGVLMMSATLDDCVERMSFVAECLAYWKHFSTATA
jgi:hypothetical protein